MFVDEKTARIRFSADADASNYILVLKEFGGAEIVSTTIIDPTGLQSFKKLFYFSN